jgi:hypothetical protein
MPAQEALWVARFAASKTTTRRMSFIRTSSRVPASLTGQAPRTAT